MDRPEPVDRRAALIVVVPLLAALGGWGLAGLGVAGVHPFWSAAPVTLPEAAAMRAGWEVVSQFRLGADPNAPMPVSPRILDVGRARLSAWEAAAAADRADVIELLAREGARLDPDVGRAAVCLAQEKNRRDSLEALVRLYHVDASQPCPAAAETRTSR